MTLRRRLLFLILMTLPLGLFSGGVLSYLYSVSLVRQEVLGAVRLGETTVREVVETLPRSSEPAQQIARLVASFDNDRDVRVSHVSPDGTTVSTSRMAPISSPPPEWLQQALADPMAPSVIELPEDLKHLGTLRVEATPINEISEVWEEMTLQFMIMGGFFSLVLWLVWWTLGRELRPLEKLSLALSEVGAGNFAAHVAEGGPQELAAIYREFNRMAKRLDEAENQNRALNMQLTTVQEEERADIARDLHDEIGPFLFAVDVDAQTIPQYLQRDMPEEAVSRSSSIRQSVAHMQTHLRGILSRLRPAALLDLGLAQAVDQVVQFWRRRHPDLEIVATIGQASFGADLDEVAFRTIQESLNNAVRHGKPARIEIKAEVAMGELVVSIRDDGSGLKKETGPGFGLAGMRERVMARGGRLDLSEGGNGKGVQVTAVLPIERQGQGKQRTATERASTL